MATKIAALDPATQQDIREGRPFKVPGLGRFFHAGFSPKGQERRLVETWYLRFSYHGVRHCPSLNTMDPEEAIKRGEKKRDEIINKVARHEPVGPEANRLKAEHLFELVKEHTVGACPQNLRRVIQLWTLHLLIKFADWRAVDITPLSVDEFIDTRRAEGASQEEIRKEVGSLKQAFRLAVAKRLISLYHVPVFPELKGSNPRNACFKEHVVRAAIKHMADEAVKRVILFAILTGWRKSEILNLKWSQVDFQAGEIRLNAGETKNGKGRVFPFFLLPELKTLIEEQRKHTDAVQQQIGAIVPWVFHRSGKRIKEFRRSWKTAVRKAGLPDRIFHDFRRSAVRNLVRAGVPAKLAMQLTGHRTRSVFDRYAITEEGEDLANAVARLAKYRETLRETLAEEQTKVVAGNFGSP